MIQEFDQTFESSRSWRAHNGRLLASTSTRSRGRRILMTGSSDDSVAVWSISASKALNNETVHRQYDGEFFTCRSP